MKSCVLRLFVLIILVLVVWPQIFIAEEISEIKEPKKQEDLKKMEESFRGITLDDLVLVAYVGDSIVYEHTNHRYDKLSAKQQFFEEKVISLIKDRLLLHSVELRESDQVKWAEILEEDYLFDFFSFSDELDGILLAGEISITIEIVCVGSITICVKW